MSAGPRRRRLADETGASLVEVLVTSTLAVVVLLAVLAAFDAFGRGAAAADATADAQEQARSGLRQVVRLLRDAPRPDGAATPLRAAGPDGVVVATGPDPEGGRATGWARVCAAAIGGRTELLVGRLSGAAYADPGACAPGANAGGWRYGRALARPLADARVFDFAGPGCLGVACDPAAAPPGAIGTVGVTLRVAARGRPVVLRGAVTLRNRTGR